MLNKIFMALILYLYGLLTPQIIFTTHPLPLITQLTHTTHFLQNLKLQNIILPNLRVQLITKHSLPTLLPSIIFLCNDDLLRILTFNLSISLTLLSRFYEKELFYRIRCTLWYKRSLRFSFLLYLHIFNYKNYQEK